MKKLSLLSLLAIAPALAGSLGAQSNVVPGLDGRLVTVDQLTYWGRRGAAYPGGEVGMSMLNLMCNPGTVQIPWQAAMQPNHPKFGFLIVRQDNGRMEQISDRSYCKHAFTSTNASGVCGTCQSTGGLGGTVMGINCSDTYGAGNNADRNWLGPADEIDPWLGTWNPVGSYFDQGDPNVGPPNNNDGVRSPSYSGSDQVHNRVTVKESDLIVPGASYYYGIHLIHQGEAVANRGDNLASRGFTPSWNGSTWSFANNGVGQVWGSILQHWTGATVTSGGNGNNDGRFFVGVKVTALGGGQYHYEYAVHNVDNSRGGATFRVPVAAGAVTSNYTFRDIDSNALDDWSAARVGNEVVWSAPANNPLNWNTIYNFSLDCNIAPGSGAVILDEARVGAGALNVTVLSTIPGGMPVATVTNVGTGCGGTACNLNVFYENFASSASFDLANSGLTMTKTAGGYQAGNGTGSFVPVTGSSVDLNLGDDTNTTVALPFSMPIIGGTTNTLWVCSNGFVSTADNGTSYQPTPSAVLSGAYCWYATWMDLNPGSTGSGHVYADSSAAMVRITWNGVYQYGNTLPSTFQLQFFPNGNVNYIWQSMNAGTPSIVAWSVGVGAVDPGQRDISATRGAGWSLCSGGVPDLALDSATRPVIGTTVNLVTSNIPSGTQWGTVLLSTQQQIPPLDLTSQGMPGCFNHVANGISTNLFLSPGATSTYPLVVPNFAVLIGLPVISQSFTYSPGRTPLGVIASNGVLLLVGQI